MRACVRVRACDGEKRGVGAFGRGQVRMFKATLTGKVRSLPKSRAFCWQKSSYRVYIQCYELFKGFFYGILPDLLDLASVFMQ